MRFAAFLFVAAVVSPSVLAIDASFGILGHRKDISLGCLVTRCGGALISCMVDPICRSMIGCLKQCDSRANPEQCSVSCFFNHETSNPKIREFFGCMIRKMCVRSQVSSCPRPRLDSLPLLSGSFGNFNVSALYGQWYVSLGLSRVYDCWKCQRMRLSPRPDSTKFLDYEYDMEVTDGILHTIPSIVELDESETRRMYATYRVSDLFTGTDHWHVLDAVSDHVLIYYCGKSELDASEYQGAIVMSRHQGAVPSNILSHFQEILELASVGVSLGNFCRNSFDNCAYNQ